MTAPPRQQQWRLQHQLTLQPPPSDPPSPTDRVSAFAWRVPAAEGQTTLAVAIAGAKGRPTVHLFDTAGQRVDRIPLKPAVRPSRVRGGSGHSNRSTT